MQGEEPRSKENSDKDSEKKAAADVQAGSLQSHSAAPVSEDRSSSSWEGFSPAPSNSGTSDSGKTDEEWNGFSPVPSNSGDSGSGEIDEDRKRSSPVARNR